MNAGLTPEMAACRDAIRRLTVNDVPPSYDELRIALGLASKASVHRLLHQLQDRGVVTLWHGQARSLRFTEDELSPARLERLNSEKLRAVAADIAGILAHRAGEGAAAEPGVARHATGRW